MKEIKQLEEQLNLCREELEQSNYEVEEKVYALEEQLNELMHEYDHMTYEKEFKQLRLLKQKLKQIKTDFDFYDEQAELDMMFPNRHDDDFDEDSMSYDSVFGDD